MKPSVLISSVTERLYYTDSEAASFDARCLSCEPAKTEGLYETVLDRTLFFPEGGGQTADTGLLSFGEVGVRVLDVQEHGGAIVHFTDGPIQKNTAVHGVLDYDERLVKMQNHGGEHILSGIIHSRYGYNNVGFHMGGDVTLDVSGPLSDEDLAAVEYAANAVVWQDRPIVAAFHTAAEADALEYRSKLTFTDPDETVRLVTVEGVDTCACCAPHLSSAGKIGLIKILDAIPYKGGMRLFFRCGADALAEFNRRQSICRTVGTSLSAKLDKIPDTVEQLKSENARLSHDLVAAERRMAGLRISSLTSAKNGSAALFFDSTDMNLLRYAAESIKSTRDVRLAAVFGGEESSFRYCICADGVPLRAIGKTLNELFSGKGGGKDEMISGSLTGAENELREFIEALEI